MSSEAVAGEDLLVDVLLYPFFSVNSDLLNRYLGKATE